MDYSIENNILMMTTREMYECFYYGTVFEDGDDEDYIDDLIEFITRDYKYNVKLLDGSDKLKIITYLIDKYIQEFDADVLRDQIIVNIHNENWGVLLKDYILEKTRELYPMDISFYDYYLEKKLEEKYETSFNIAINKIKRCTVIISF